jgi:hypothetical protein
MNIGMPTSIFTLACVSVDVCGPTLRVHCIFPGGGFSIDADAGGSGCGGVVDPGFDKWT